jgi:DNA-binding NtrC family response regulator
VRTIYVVEDDAGVRGLLERVLGEDFRLRSFASGREALNALQASPPDVLLTDLEIPDIVGEDLAWMASHVAPRPRVVLMSGNPRRLSAAAHLAQATVSKPFDLAALRGLLEPQDPSAAS